MWKGDGGVGWRSEVNLKVLLVFKGESLLMLTLAKTKDRKKVAKLWVIESRMQAPSGMPSLVLEKTNVHAAIIDF